MSEQPIWDEWAQQVYLTSLARDIRYAQLALAEVRGRANRTPPDPLAWMPLETFLMFTAKVSKTFRPTQMNNEPKKPGPARDAHQRRKFRGERLCELLGVDDASPIWAREVRDASEHFDERLDEWIFPHPRASAEEMEAGETVNFIPPPARTIDPTSWDVEVSGQTLNLDVIGVELRRILDQVTELEPLAAVIDPVLGMMLAGLPPMPAELRLDAPTRRSDESVHAGVDGQEIAARQKEFDEAIARVVETFTKHDEEHDDPRETSAGKSREACGSWTTRLLTLMPWCSKRRRS